MTTDDPFDPSNLALTATTSAPAPPKRGGTTRPRATAPFLKGPVPWSWLTAAAGLPGKALAAGVALWFEAGCKKRRTVRVTHDRLTRLGMSPSTARRALRCLAKNKLIALTARPGAATEVTILNAPEAGPHGGGR
jgi:hypothetical protein